MLRGQLNPILPVPPVLEVEALISGRGPDSNLTPVFSPFCLSTTLDASLISAAPGTAALKSSKRITSLLFTKEVPMKVLVNLQRMATDPDCRESSLTVWLSPLSVTTSTRASIHVMAKD